MKFFPWLLDVFFANFRNHKYIKSQLKGVKTIFMWFFKVIGRIKSDTCKLWRMDLF